MSHEAINLVLNTLDLTGLSPAERWTLLRVADRTDAETWDCFPSHDWLAKKAGVKRRSMVTYLATLEERGFISRSPRFRDDGTRSTDLITFHRCANIAPPGATNGSPPVQTTAPAPAEFAQHIQVIEPGKITHGVVAQARDGFEAWWLLYPRKVDKAGARTAFAKALGKTTDAILCQATVRFADEVNDRPRDKIPHPATWLNGERWDDEPEANRSQTDARRDQSAGPIDRGAARANASFDAMVDGGRETLDRRSADRAEQRRRWGFSDPAAGHQPDAAGGVRAALPAPDRSGTG